MTLKTRNLIRAAGLIQEALAKRRQIPTPLSLPERGWAECLRIFRQMRRATELGWYRAAAQLRKQMLYEVSYCRSSLHQVTALLDASSLQGAVPSVADIYRDLAALETEFEDVQCEFETDELCIMTPSITLEGIDLGPFQIRLGWSRLDESPAYRVVALAANPASSNESIAHPHVCDEVVCEGDGHQAICAALDEGRIADFFLLVWRLLATYAPGRAYVEMSDWSGAPCNGCGDHVNENDDCSCSRCERVFCAECTACCEHCEENFCTDCMSQCTTCSSSICRGCRDSCEDCQAVLCPDCVSDRKCWPCRQAPSEESAASESQQQASPANIQESEETA